MNELSLTQAYVLCAVNGKGKLSSFEIEKHVCFAAAGLLELQFVNCIQIEKKKVSIINELPLDRIYLKSLYDYVNQAKPVKLEKIMDAYNYSLSDKRVHELLGAINTSLYDLGYVEKMKTGLFGNKFCYIPKKEAIQSIIDMVKSEMFTTDVVREDIAALVILLNKSNILKTYVSSFERKEMKAKLKVIINSENGIFVKWMIDYVESMVVVMNSVATFSS